MSQWHRENPELVGTAADPWMQHESYRKAMREHWRESGDYCRECGVFLMNHERGVCEACS
jgi:hypothetical protein